MLKISQSLQLIKDYKIYYLLLVLLFIRGTPSLIETTEYYCTNILLFNNQQFGFIFILQTFMVIVAVLLIKYQIYNSYSKISIGVIYFLIIITSFITFVIFEDLFPSLIKQKTILVFFRAGLYSFSLETVIIILFNIYITICPKDVEGTFSTLYFSISYLSQEIGSLLATLF